MVLACCCRSLAHLYSGRLSSLRSHLLHHAKSALAHASKSPEGGAPAARPCMLSDQTILMFHACILQPTFHGKGGGWKEPEPWRATAADWGHAATDDSTPPTTM